MADFSTTCAIVILTSEDQNGIIRTIRLGINQSVRSRTSHSYSKRGESPGANLTGLIRDESYNVSVLVTTDKGNGPYSVPIILTTNENSEYFETFIWNSKTNTVAALFFFFASTIPSTTGSIRKTNYCVIH